MASTEIQEGCLRTAVRHRAGERPRVSAVCHCKDCRRACGAQSVAEA